LKPIGTLPRKKNTHAQRDTKRKDRDSVTRGTYNQPPPIRHMNNDRNLRRESDEEEFMVSLNDVLGPPVKPLPTDIRTTYDLMEYYPSRNDYISIEFERETLFKDSAFWIDFIAPIQLTDKKIIRRAYFKFDRAYAAPTAVGAPSRFVTFEERETFATLGRRGIGLEVPVGFHLEPRGLMIFQGQLVSMLNAKMEASKMETIGTLLNQITYYEEMMRDTSTTVSRDWYFQEKVYTFGCLQRWKNALHKLCETVHSRVSKANNGAVDTIITNEKVQAFLRLVPKENTDYYMTGMLPYDFKQMLDMKESVYKFANWMVCIQRPLNVREKDPLDFLLTRTQISFHHFLYNRMKGGINAPYKSQNLSIQIWDYERRGIVSISLKQALEHCQFDDVIKKWVDKTYRSVTDEGLDENGKKAKLKTIEGYVTYQIKKERDEIGIIDYMVSKALENNVSMEFDDTIEYLKSLTDSDVVCLFSLDKALESDDSQSFRDTIEKSKKVLFGYSNHQSIIPAESYIKTLTVMNKYFNLIKVLGKEKEFEHMLFILYYLFGDEPITEILDVIREALRLSEGEGREEQFKNLMNNFSKYFSGNIARVIRGLTVDTVEKLEGWPRGTGEVKEKLKKDSLRDVLKVVLSKLELKKENMNTLIGLDIPLPFAFIIERANVELEMSGMIFLARNSKTCSRWMSRDVFTMGQNDQTQMIHGHLTCYMGTEVHEPRNLYIENNALINRVIRGMGTVFHTNPNEYLPLRPYHATSQRCSLHSFLVGYHEVIPGPNSIPNPMDIRGTDDLSLDGMFDDPRKDPHYSTADIYGEIWNFSRHIVPEHHIDPLMKTMTSAMNPVSWIGYTEYYDPMTGEYSDIQQQTGELSKLVGRNGMNLDGFLLSAPGDDDLSMRV
jgi:hypothetical protein